MTDPDLTSRLYDDSDDSEIDPFTLFELWLGEAREAELNDPNAMAFASVDGEGMPDVRMLLMNGWDARGFVFYTNFDSTKAEQLLENPKAAGVFHWKALRRQIRVRGPVEIVTSAEADAYFATRPLGSRVGAHASEQSRPLKNRAELVARTKKLEAEMGDEVPRPKNWSGFRLQPLHIEFWKDGEFRLHDRVVFQRANLSDNWTHMRLNP